MTKNYKFYNPKDLYFASFSALNENPVYGLNRLGVFYRQAVVGLGWNGYTYQLTDHLGNVRAVVRKTPTGIRISGATDYYPFGMPMPNRHKVDANNYRYAYQGQEKDPETGKEAFELRLWDGRIGRWLTTDPARQFSSPYLGMGNNPVQYVDKRGDTIRASFRVGFFGIFGKKQVLTYDQEQGQWLDENKNIYTGKLPRFYKRALTDLNKLYTDPDGKNYIDYLANDRRDLFVARNFDNINRRDDKYLKYSGRDEPTKNRNVGKQYFLQPSYQILGHELWHKFAQYRNFPNPPWSVPERGFDEVRACHFENKLRGRNGDVLREFYDGSNPNSRLIKAGTRQSIHYPYDKPY